MYNNLNNYLGVIFATIFLLFSWYPLLVDSQIYPTTPVGCSKVSYSAEKLATIPASFDARDKWGDCISPVRTQKGCGSCWAQVTSGLLADRTCIATNGLVKTLLSPQYILGCSNNCKEGGQCNIGCRGGYIDVTLAFLESNGVVSDVCLPYQANDGSCPSTCSNGESISNATKVKAGKCYTYASLQDVQYEIMTKGPVIATFALYPEFSDYSGGVFVRTSNNIKEGHAARVYGWGNENGVDYWLAANSWGTSWGINGHFKIRRGTDEVGFEDNFISADANTDDLSETLYGSTWSNPSSGSALKPSFYLILTIIAYLILVPLFQSFA
ncbi:hypothetical protein CYY_008902 [Polysphondylium violaceum]|uniref:Peptidase C1A papain C-terminal domain-containing protein n=1 Tax=Polysphondylium violaceum TaxID=133409 RepID=A0A8J4V3H2_9MYCE|nr:hypothetical protein CYY_008902 [Polysphondylium violaceum]